MTPQRRKIAIKRAGETLYVGSTQHRMICEMIRYGKGVWQFHLNGDKIKVLDSLLDKKLVERFSVGLDDKLQPILRYRLVPGIEILCEQYGGEGLVNQ